MLIGCEDENLQKEKLLIIMTSSTETITISLFKTSILFNIIKSTLVRNLDDAFLSYQFRRTVFSRSKSEPNVLHTRDHPIILMNIFWFYAR